MTSAGTQNARQKTSTWPEPAKHAVTNNFKADGVVSDVIAVQTVAFPSMESILRKGEGCSHVET